LWIRGVQYIIQFLRLSTIMPLEPDLKILSLDTSSIRGSVALLAGWQVVADLRLLSTDTHSKRLIRCIHFLLHNLGWDLGELNLVAAGIGPGSFTGIRIGVATAIGIAQSLAIPFAGISCLDALAHEVPILDGDIAVLLDAQRSQAYYAEYTCRGGRIRTAQKAGLLHFSDLERRLADRHLYILGDVKRGQLGRFRSSATAWPRFVQADLFLAAGIGRLALSKRRIWRSGDYPLAEPLYIRPPDAVKGKSRTR